MYNVNLAGKIQTVNGLIEPENLGITLTHEHLFCDQSGFSSVPTEANKKSIFFDKVSQENLGYIRHHYFANADNGQLWEIESALQEANLYKQFGGHGIVDVTSIGVGRDAVGLFRIANTTGLNIIMGASYYQNLSHPQDMDDKSEEEITEEIIKDITIGVNNTGIKSGIIGEVGLGWPIYKNELKVLKASGKAQKLTGAPLLIHPGRDENAPYEIIEILNDVGADLSSTVMGHVERTVFQKDILLKIAESGCYINWDLIGEEDSYYGHYKVKGRPTDAGRMDQIEFLIEEGYKDQILLAHDLCNKGRLTKYGGHGLHYILSHIIPRMRSRGYSEESINSLLIENPKKMLTFKAV